MKTPTDVIIIMYICEVAHNQMIGCYIKDSNLFTHLQRS